MSSLRITSLIFLILFTICGISLCLNGAYPVTGDDTWGATAVLGNPLEVIIFTLRWDIHPPLYYSFLDLWSIVNKSDYWLRLSSSFLHSLVSTIAFYYVLKRHGLFAACITVSIIFASPLLLNYSTNIRMYSLISFLSISIFYLTEKFITKPEKKYLFWLFILGLILTNSHAIGILFVFFHFCYGFYYIHTDRHKFIVWVLTHLALAILAIPAMANGFVRKVGHASQPSHEQLLSLFQSLFISGNSAFIIISIALTGLMLKEKSVRIIVIAYLIFPLVFIAMLSYTIKPMWLDRNFIFAIPMLCIAAGICIYKLKLPLPIKLLIPILLISINLKHSSLFKNYDNSSDQFRQVIDVLEKNTINLNSKSCIMTTNTMNTFWSLQRYLNATEWGNPIQIQPPLSDRWKQISDRSPWQVKKLLALEPKPNFSEFRNLIISSGFSDRCIDSDVDKVFIVTEDILVLDNKFNLIFSNSSYNIYEGPNNLDEEIIGDYFNKTIK